MSGRAGLALTARPGALAMAAGLLACGRPAEPRAHARDTPGPAPVARECDEACEPAGGPPRPGSGPRPAAPGPSDDSTDGAEALAPPDPVGDGDGPDTPGPASELEPEAAGPPGEPEPPQAGADAGASAEDAADPVARALADELAQARRAFGQAVLEAWLDDDYEAFAATTPTGSVELAGLCPSLGLQPEELAARYRHCRREIPWDAVEGARVVGGEPRGQGRAGCVAGVAARDPVSLIVTAGRGRKARAWQLELHEVFAHEGVIAGHSGRITCRKLAPGR